MFGVAGASPSLRQFYDMPIFLFQALPHVSYARYANEAFYLPLIQKWEYLKWTSQGLDLNYSLKTFYAYSMQDYNMNVTALFLNGFIYRALTYITLWDDGWTMSRLGKRRLWLDEKVRSLTRNRSQAPEREQHNDIELNPLGDNKLFRESVDIDSARATAESTGGGHQRETVASMSEI
jgi:hypothetical protein